MGKYKVVYQLTALHVMRVEATSRGEAEKAVERFIDSGDDPWGFTGGRVPDHESIEVIRSGWRDLSVLSGREAREAERILVTLEAIKEK